MLNYTGPIFIIIAATLWAFDGLIRQHLYTLPPITIIFFEHLIGLIILTPFVYKYVFATKLAKKEWWLIILIAVLSGLLGTLWFTTALGKVHFISLSVVFLLQKLQPIFAITTARIFLKEQFDQRYIKWAILALISAFFVTFPNGHVNLDTGEGTIIAALYALGAAFAWGSSTTFSKMLLSKVDFRVSTFYRFLFTIIFTSPFFLWLRHKAIIHAPQDVGLNIGWIYPNTVQLGWLTLIAISTGMVALLIYYRGLEKTPVHISTILELSFPFIAIFIDMKVNHTSLSISQWMASLVLVFSIYQISKLRENI
jgi:drug/metabolite transporter (DMT)-like permease